MCDGRAFGKSGQDIVEGLWNSDKCVDILSGQPQREVGWVHKERQWPSEEHG